LLSGCTNETARRRTPSSFGADHADAVTSSSPSSSWNEGTERGAPSARKVERNLGREQGSRKRSTATVE
jgi:hypothetical protein